MSVFFRTKALLELGHQVDLLAYNQGQDVDLEGLEIIRIPPIFFIKKIGIGPSLTKIPLDLLLFLKAIMLLSQKDYDYIHAHEEASVFAVFLKKVFNIPLIYDMHSSMPQQLVNYNFTHNTFLIWLFSCLENKVVSASDAIIVVCRSLEKKAKKLVGHSSRIILIENVESISHSAPQSEVESLRNSLNINKEKIVLYTGTFEHNQGLDILIKSIPYITETDRNVKFLLVGGKDQQIDQLRSLAKELRVEPYVIFTGSKRIEEIPKYLQLADVLVSARSVGKNTPLKLYSYIKSGRPIVATRIEAHKVLDQYIANLTEVNERDFARGILEVVENPRLAKKLSRNAKLLAKKYSKEVFLNRTAKIEDILKLKTSKMRILMLNYEYPPIGGGAGNATYYILKEFSKREDIEVDLVTSSPTDNFEQEQMGDNIRIYKLPVNKKEIHYWSQKEIISYSWKAYKLMKKLRGSVDYDLIHAFFGIPCGGIAYKFRREIPYIVSLRGSDVPGFDERFSLQYVFLRPILRRIWRNASAVVANSEWLKELALKTDKNADIDIIHNGINIEDFKPGNSNSDEFVILTVARLIRRKGIDDLIRAIPAVVKEDQNIKLKIIGEGNMESELKELAQRLGVSKYIEFLGYVPHEELPDHYSFSDVFVLPSKNEGMPNAVLEAMASGLPIITTDAGGSKELIDGNGIIIKIEDPDKIANSILELRKNQELRENMGARSRNIAEKLSWEIVAQDYLEKYEELIK